MDMLAAIRAQREEIARKVNALQAEDADLAVAERVVARLLPAIEETPSSARSGQQPRQIDLIVSALGTIESSWASDWSELQKAIMDRYSVEIPKSSLQPYLSNLKNEGIIVRDGPRIALKLRVAKGAGPGSDNSYDPDVAAAADDDERPSITHVTIRPRPRFGITSSSTKP